MARLAWNDPQHDTEEVFAFSRDLTEAEERALAARRVQQREYRARLQQQPGWYRSFRSRKAG